ALKIDASIVAALQAGGRAASLVDSLVAYGTATGTRIIAAGVETTAQCRDLRARGVEYAQGFLFSPARPAPEIDALLAQGRLHARAGGA
ncbi:MAG: EAL domain-containing protein, partial [Gammaproteobacteria bacterium]